MDITVDDIVSIKTALMKLGISTPESNDLSDYEILKMIRDLAYQVRAGIYL